MSEESNYEAEIRKRLTKRYENRAQFWGNVVAFVLFNGILWLGFTPQGFGYGIAMLITGGWAIGLAIHLVNYWVSEARERAIEQAIERERQWRSGTVPEGEMKRKRERLSDIADDGELIEIEDEYPQSARRQR